MDTKDKRTGEPPRRKSNELRTERKEAVAALRAPRPAHRLARRYPVYTVGSVGTGRLCQARGILAVQSNQATPCTLQLLDSRDGWLSARAWCIPLTILQTLALVLVAPPRPRPSNPSLRPSPTTAQHASAPTISPVGSRSWSAHTPQVAQDLLRRLPAQQSGQ